MGQVTVRELDDAVIERLKARAAGNNRSLEAELREILTGASTQLSDAEARARAEAMRQRFAAVLSQTRPS
jgi:antitoxin FitA